MSSIPAKCKAAHVKKAGDDFQIVEIDVPKPQKNQVLIKTLACGICHSDGVVKHQAMPHCTNQAGHEVIGKIVALGEGVESWKVGQTVGGAWHGGHCFDCPSCRKGDFVTCQKQAINGITQPGGHAEYVVLRSEAVIPIPEDMDPAESCPLLCAGITVFNSMRSMDKLRPGDLVAVQGIGGLGHLALQFARQMGFRVVALSQSASKKDLALKLGAHDYLDASKVNTAEELQKMGGASLIVCTAPSSDAINTLLPGLGVDGTILILAVPQEPLSLPVMPMIMKRLSLRGWPSGIPKDSEDTLAFAKLHGVKCQIEKYPLDKINEAYKQMESGKVRFRSVITFDA